MNRQRGFQLAGIHLTVAAALIGWDVDREWRHALNPPTEAPMVLTAWQETESSVPFDPCHGKGYLDYFVTPEQRTVQIDNLPVWALSGWSIPCPRQWTVAGMLQYDSVRFSFRKYVLISAIFCVLMPVQWFLLGAFPLVKRQRWFFEPGTLITICTMISTFLILLTKMLPISEAVGVVSTLLMAFQLLMWLYWCALIVWKNLYRLSHRYRAQTTTHS